MGLLDAIKRRATFLLPKIHFRLILLSRASTKISKSVFYFYQLRLFFFSPEFYSPRKILITVVCIKVFHQIYYFEFYIRHSPASLSVLVFFFHESRCSLFLVDQKRRTQKIKQSLNFRSEKKCFSFFSCQHEGLTPESRNFFHI